MFQSLFLEWKRKSLQISKERTCLLWHDIEVLECYLYYLHIPTQECEREYHWNNLRMKHIVLCFLSICIIFSSSWSRLVILALFSIDSYIFYAKKAFLFKFFQHLWLTFIARQHKNRSEKIPKKIYNKPENRC